MARLGTARTKGMQARQGLPPAPRAVAILTGFVAAVVYGLLAWATFGRMAALLAAGKFYRLTDFYPATWLAGRMLRAGQVFALYHAAWLYPPTMAVVAVMASWLPLGAAYWAWCGGTMLLAAALLRVAGLDWWIIVAGVCGPAEFYNILLGQNGALTGGILVSSLLAMAARPRLGGGLAGILCIKPQIGFLIPVVLWRRRGGIGAAALTVAALLAVSLGIAGWRAWPLFITVAQPEAHRQLVVPFGQEFQLADYSVFMMARSWGTGLGVAWAVQGVSTAAAVCACWVTWGLREADAVARMAVTVCLGMLAAPFGFSYDLVSLSVAVAALLPRVRPAVWPVLAGLWLWPGLSILITLETKVVLLPVAALAGLAVAAPLLSGKDVLLSEKKEVENYD